MQAIESASVITQIEFDKYAAEWQRIISIPGSPELQDIFINDEGHVFQGISFPVSEIIHLMSTVGATHIKARFMVRSGSTKPYFTVALFATDSLDARLSLFYTSDSLYVSQVATADGMNVADVLARDWLSNWAAVKKVDSTMFDTTYGYLRGYTFDFKDFMSTLAELNGASEEQIEAATLLMSFGLHKYYRAGADADTLANTLGLILHMSNTSAGDTTVEDPFYDVSQPCPPIC